MCPTITVRIRHVCTHREPHPGIPQPWPAQLVWINHLAKLPCTGCIASGTLKAQVRKLLDGGRRQLFAKRDTPEPAGRHFRHPLKPAA